MVLLALGGMAGCASAPAVAPSAPTQPDRRSWADVPCDAVADRNREACLAEHARLGIPDNQSTTSAATAAAQDRIDEQMRLAADVPTAADAIERAHQAVDAMLGDTLKDPMSAIQYRVTPIVPCVHVLDAGSLLAYTRLCVCYEVNAKNSYGGYDGARMGVAAIGDDRDGTDAAHALEPERYQRLYRDACAAAGFEKRSSALIHATVD